MLFYVFIQKRFFTELIQPFIYLCAGDIFIHLHDCTCACQSTCICWGNLKLHVWVIKENIRYMMRYCRFMQTFYRLFQSLSMLYPKNEYWRVPEFAPATVPYECPVPHGDAACSDVIGSLVLRRPSTSGFSLFANISSKACFLLCFCFCNSEVEKSGRIPWKQSLNSWPITTNSYIFW